MPESWVERKQLKKFRKTFEYACRNSTFYKKFYKDTGVYDLKIKTFEDVNKIPLVDKAMLNHNKIEDILSRDNTKDLVVTNTSGSTGVPIDIYSTKKELFAGYVRTFLATKHYNPFRRFGFIGLYDHKKEIERNTFLYYCQKYCGLFRRECFSVFTPSEELIAQLKAKKISVLSTTPSGLRILVDKLKESGEKLNLKVIVVSGETVMDELRSDVKTYLKAKMIDVYGCMEHPSLAWTNPDGNFFIYPSNSVYVEFINPVEIGGVTYGELVITNFSNNTMPFIRYKIGDHVKILNSNKKMGKILGRIDDIIEYDDGYKIFMIQLYPFDSIFDYSQYKVIQRKNRNVYFQAVCNQGVNRKKLEKRIIREWEICFGNHQVEVEFVDALPIDKKTGKFKLIECEK